MWLTLEQIEYLQAVKQEGSITSAALAVGKAKSAIYYSIKRLEEQLGFQLVHTKRYRGSLTPKGERFVEQAVPLLKQMETLKEQAHQIATGVELKITLSATAIIPMSLITAPIRGLQQKYPDTEIVFHREIMSGEKFLTQKIVDVAICETLHTLPNFEYHIMGKSRLTLMIAADHPFLKLEQQTMEGLFDYPQIVQRATIPSDEDGGIYKKSKQWTVSDLSAKKDLIADGLGWGRLPFHIAKTELQEGRLVELTHIENPVEMPIYLVRRRDSKPGRVLTEIWETLSQIKL